MIADNLFNQLDWSQFTDDQYDRQPWPAELQY